MENAIAQDGHDWIIGALRILDNERCRSEETNLLKLALPATWGVEMYLKNEAGHPSGSLKHRLARSLFVDGLVSGLISSDTAIIEASSGSTAVSEAYFAQMLGLRFVTVIPRGTAKAKIDTITRYGGRCVFVNAAGEVRPRAEQLCHELGGHFMDQFANASRVVDWRRDNIASSIVQQMRDESHPVPTWIVVGAGTGGTSATVGRFCRYRGLATRLVVADPVGSAFGDFWASGETVSARGSRIEGVGRPEVEGAFLSAVVDRMLRVDDITSIAAMHALHRHSGIKAGGSSGMNFAAALYLVAEMRASGTRGSVVSLICDSGDRYEDTYYNERWLAANGMNAPELVERLVRVLAGQVPRLTLDGVTEIEPVSRESSAPREHGLGDVVRTRIRPSQPVGTSVSRLETRA